MKNSKVLTVITIAIIIAQLFIFANTANVNADSMSSSTQEHNSQSHNYGAFDFSKNLYNCFNILDLNKPPILLNPHANGGVDHLVISPKTATIAAGQSQTYTAKAYNRGGNSHNISTLPGIVWSINSGAGTYVWTGSTVQVTKAGTWTITATYKGKTDTATLTVTHANLNKLDHITASLNPQTVQAPNTVVGTATAYDIYGNSWDISTLATWSIPAGNDGGSWLQNIYTSHNAGTYTVQASYQGKTATISLTVTNSTPVAQLDHITIAPASSTIPAGSAQSYTATATDSSGHTWDITADISTSNGWSISSDAGGSWNGATYTSAKAGEWTVTGTYLGKTATATLTVTHATSAAYLDHITASINPTTIAAPNTATGTATAYDSFGNNWDISTTATWSIPAGGDGGIWTQNIYTSKTAGTYTVQAAYQDKTATTSLTVTHATDQAYLDHIAIAPKIATVNAGIPQTYTTTAYDTFGNSWSVTATYNCPNTQVVITDNSAYSNLDGSYTITATYSGKSDTATLTVTGHLPTIIAITVSPQIASIEAGTSQTFAATASDGYNTWDVTSTVTWNIDTAAGGSWAQSTGTYTAAKAGNWTVKATLNTLSDTASLTVSANPALLSYIVINPKNATISAGTSQSYNATAYDEFGNSLGDITSSTTFTAPGTSVNGNVITADNTGSYNVTATYTGLTDTASLTTTGYAITFTENGLPTGTNWNITFSGQIYSSTNNTITINGLSALNYSWSTSNNIQNAQTRYITNQTSGNITIPSQLTQNIDYSTQYLVTYSVTGNTLPVSVPETQWVDSGGQATGSFPAQIINEAQDTQCNFLNDNRSATITQPTTITGTYQTQYRLTVTTPYSTATGAGWFDSGSSATITISSGTVSSGNQVQYVFSNWSGDASGTSLTSTIVMNSPKTATASWNTQYLVTYTVTGNVLSINAPPNEWVNSGTAAQGKFTPTATNSANDTQCLLQNDNRTSTITAPTTITGNYQTQYKVTFNQTGIQSDAKGTIITIQDNPQNYTQLPNETWINTGATITFTFNSTVASTITNKDYTLTSVNATSPITINAPTTIQANYQTQNSTSLYTIAEIAIIIFVILLTTISLIRYRNQRKQKQQNINITADAKSP